MKKLKKSDVFDRKAVCKVKVGAQTFLGSNVVFRIAPLASTEAQNDSLHLYLVIAVTLFEYF